MDKRLKKTVMTAAALACAVLFALYMNRTVGSVSGPENDRIFYKGAEYVMDASSGFSIADRGRYLGKVKNGNVTMRIFTVRGDRDMEYLYALWDWEGSVYRIRGGAE